MAQPFSPKHSTNLQISTVIDAIGQTEPELFGQGNATLMPVQYSDRLASVICDSSLGETIPTKLETTRTRLMRVARKHADAQVAYWRELYAYELPYKRK
jgi:hypothetical protein